MANGNTISKTTSVQLGLIIVICTAVALVASWFTTINAKLDRQGEQLSVLLAVQWQRTDQIIWAQEANALNPSIQLPVPKRTKPQ